MTRLIPAATRRRSESGATIVELAFVSVLLITIIAGAFDYGSAWRSSLAITEGTRTGARVGSAQGPLRGADFYALSGVKAALASSGELAGVQRVVIFKSTSATGQVPEICKTSSNSSCQAITGTNLRTNWETLSVNAATSTTGCLNIAVSPGWCPTSRENRQELAEYYGIWIKSRYNYQFPLLGSGVDIERTATMRLEPKVE